MEVVIVIVGAAVVVGGMTRLVFMGRARRRERHEVENMFAPDRDDNAWWEERH